MGVNRMKWFRTAGVLCLTLMLIAGCRLNEENGKRNKTAHPCHPRSRFLTAAFPFASATEPESITAMKVCMKEKRS